MQDNEYDCGVFVCRYAFAMLHLLDTQIKMQTYRMEEKEVKDQSHQEKYHRDRSFQLWCF